MSYDNGLPCECGHGERRHWFYQESCLDCDCGRYFQAEDI
jgi:hypothetical protein